MDTNIFNVLPKYKNKQEIAYDEIKNAIIQCHFRPGDSLVIRTLASQLGISEIPVREALRRLISEGFVTETSNGLLITPITTEEFLSMMEIKLKLEILAIKVSAKKATEEQLAHLRRILDNMAQYYADNDMKNYLLEHSKFHLECCLICGVSYMTSVLNAAFAHHERALHYFNLSLWEVQPALQEHFDILNALASHDPEAAEAHLLRNRERADQFYLRQIQAIHDQT